MIIPKIIHFTIPEHPSEEQLKNIQIARHLHPDWQVVVWQDPLDGANFRLSKYWKKTNSGAQLADLIRLEVVYQQGGFYFDSDFVIRKSLDPLRQFPFVVASEDGKLLTNAFFGSQPESPVLKHLIDALDHNEVDWTLAPNVTTGPCFFTRELGWRDDVTALPRETFYPYNWNERARAARQWTYAAHLWSHSWKPTWGSLSGSRTRLAMLKSAIKKPLITLAKYCHQAVRNRLIDIRQLLDVERPQPFSASGVIAAQTLHGFKLYLLGEDSSLTPEIALHGTYELREVRFMQRVVRPGDWVIDVGANVGLFSLLLARTVRRFGRVFAYEPNPLPASLLKKSLVMNWLHDRTVVREKALGSEPGVLQLRFSRGILGGATLASEAEAGTFNKSVSLFQDGESIDVEVSTLDAEFPVDLAIRLLKIDAEGFEHHVLSGAARLLERHCVDIMMLECSQEVYGKNWDAYLAEIKRIIDHGYGVYVLNRRSKLREISFNELRFADRDRNIVLVSKYAVDTIPELG